MQPIGDLHEVERRYEELGHKMSTPDAAADADEYARMMRDYKELTPLIEEYRRYTDLQQQEANAKEMLAAESDPAFADMVQQELCEIEMCIRDRIWTRKPTIRPASCLTASSASWKLPALWQRTRSLSLIHILRRYPEPVRCRCLRCRLRHLSGCGCRRHQRRHGCL